MKARLSFIDPLECLSEMRDLNAMALFAKVIEHGGYSAASRALGMATSKLSRHVSELEQQLGVQLVNRSTRGISLTDAGETFYRRCLLMIGEAEGAFEAIDHVRAEPRGLVRIACPVGLLFTDVGAILARYMADHPAVRIKLEATNRRVDVVEEGFDLALRASLPPLEDSQLATRTLAHMEAILACSPWFIAQHRLPTSLQDLAELPTLAVGLVESRMTWFLAEGEGKVTEFRHVPRLLTNDLAAVRRAAVEGLGVAMLPSSLIREDLAQGVLVPVLPEFRQVRRIVHLVFPSRRGLVPAVRSLIDALVAGFAQL